MTVLTDDELPVSLLIKTSLGIPQCSPTFLKKDETVNGTILGGGKFSF